MTAAPEELAKFERLGAMWRDPTGPMRVLHALNPQRTRWGACGGSICAACGICRCSIASVDEHPPDLGRRLAQGNRSNAPC